MAGDFLTLSDIAARLRLSENTVRYYIDRFEPYIPSLDGDDEATYRPESVDVLRVIHDLLESDHRPSEVEARLSRLYPKTVRIEDQDAELSAMVKAETSALSQQLANAILPVLVRQNQVMNRIADALDRLSSRDEEIESLKRTADALTRLADREDESRILESISHTLSELAKREQSQMDQAVLEQTASALEALASKDDDVRALEAELQELKKAQEASDLKRRIMEARREREQKEYYRQAEERLRGLLEKRRRPWWRFWQR